MTVIKNQALDKTLLADILNSFQKGEKRDFLKDSERYIKEQNLNFEVKYLAKDYSQKPTLVAINHYIRPILIRKSLFTTIDSMITSTIITVGLSKIFKRKTTWVVKDNLLKNILFYDLILRKAQIAVIYDYDLIAVSQNYPFGSKSAWLKKLRDGFNIAFYPEGKTSGAFKKPQNGFSKFLSYLIQEKADFQILPVSIFFERGVFKVVFSQPVSIINKDIKTAVKTTITNIASNLPKKLQNVEQAKHSEKPNNSRSQVLQQPASDQKL